MLENRDYSSFPFVSILSSLILTGLTGTEWQIARVWDEEGDRMVRATT